MRGHKVRIPLRNGIRLAIRTTLDTLLIPGYIVVVVIGTFILSGLVVWSLNIETLWYVYTQTNAGTAEKIRFFLYGFSGLFGQGSLLLRIMIGLMAAMGGIAFMLLFRAYRIRRKTSLRGAGAGMILAAISGGCAACGTSLFGPLISVFGATSVAAAYRVGAAVLLFAVTIFVVTAYRLALIIAPQE